VGEDGGCGGLGGLVDVSFCWWRGLGVWVEGEWVGRTSTLAITTKLPTTSLSSALVLPVSPSWRRPHDRTCQGETAQLR